MKTNEQIIKEIYDAMQVNKNTRAKCNTALSDAIGLIQHTERVVQDQLAEEYRRGINDAWEISRELCKIGDDECSKIFGDSSVEYVIETYSPLIIKEKIQSYRDAKDKIHVGDVVQNKNDDIKATVLDCDEFTTLENERYWTVFTENGCVETWCEDDFTRTGESVDVCNALIR